MQVNSTIYDGRQFHTKAVPSMGYVSNVPVLQYYAISQLYAFKAYKTHLSPCLIHRRPVNHPHLRSEVDLPRSILPRPSPLPPLNKSTGQISQDGGPQTFQYAVPHPQWHTRREILTSFYRDGHGSGHHPAEQYGVPSPATTPLIAPPRWASLCFVMED